jgi:glycolate oxidase iron-sulfur subunit
MTAVTPGTPANPEPEAQDAPLEPVRSIPDLASDCVHCGFCLPSCPTYLLWGEEMDSPRGRIQLMLDASTGGSLTPTVVGHLDACLGCLACVTACPSGVRYDQLIEAARVDVERRHRRPIWQRIRRAAIFRLFPYPRRLRWLRGPLALYKATRLDRALRRMRLLQRMSPTLAALESLAPRPGPVEAIPEHTYCRRYPRVTAGLVTGCVQDAFFPQVNAATVRVLAAERCDVITPRHQGCCGALSYHSGREDEARRFARALIEVFAEARIDVVVANSAGCGSAMRSYGELLRDDPAYAKRAAAFARKVRDISEVLGELEPVAERHPLPVRAAYHDACHLGHGQRVRAQPRTLLSGIPGLGTAEIREADICCGSAGLYNVLYPEPGRELGDRKAGNVLATGAELLVTGNPGCAMQIVAAVERAGGRIAVAHTVEVLDASIRGLPPETLLGRPSGPGRNGKRPEPGQ